ncbi:MAG: hypothetical protein IKQ41_12200 [Clostridia bacterium]|nr:hypothetical protein [Clostridia bacterium]
MIAQAQVMVALRPWLGEPLLAALPALPGEIAERLNGFSKERDADRMAQELDSLLFRAVRYATAGSLLAQMDDGGFVRIRLEDFADMADEMMLLVFEEFPVDSRHFLFLKDYAVHHPSLAALRTLYTRFGSFQSAQELAAIASVAKDCYRPFRWQSWLG